MKQGYGVTRRGLLLSAAGLGALAGTLTAGSRLALAETTLLTEDNWAALHLHHVTP